MNALVKVDIPALSMSEGELIEVLEGSLYPGASQASVKLVVGYCRAAHLDPLQKPVHIVPMDVKQKKPQGSGFDYVKRDVIMPGIGLYRTQAARTGEYAGISEPEFGDMRKLAFKRTVWEGSGQDRSSREVDDSIEYPDWCRVTVRRLVGGHVAEFTATEYWSENYATAGKETIAPNTMWRKRPRGQIAKCAEAQALRKAFPEVGAQPTAEEMEGKVIDGDVIDGETGVIKRTQIAGPQSKSEPAAPTGNVNDQATAATGDASASGAAADKPVTMLTDGAKETIKRAMERYGRGEADLVAANFKKLDEMPFSMMADAMKWLREHPAS